MGCIKRVLNLLNLLSRYVFIIVCKDMERASAYSSKSGYEDVSFLWRFTFLKELVIECPCEERARSCLGFGLSLNANLRHLRTSSGFVCLQTSFQCSVAKAQIIKDSNCSQSNG